jgi:hypothetical protein
MRGLYLAAAAAAALVPATPPAATVINFDEYPADNDNGGLPSNRYASLGVTIQSTDDGSTWGGISNGDPGNWDLEGTNGAIFAGFNGSIYLMSLLFATDISAFSLDASRSNGSSDGTVTLNGYLDGLLVSTNSVTLGAINQWSSIGLTGLFDQVTVVGTGTGFHPFGIDNINFSSVRAIPEPGTWAMMLIGFAGMGLAVRRRKAAAEPAAA